MISLRRLLVADAASAAPKLLGASVTHTTADGAVTVRICEVEAYAGVGEDPGSHAHRGQTARNSSMFGPPGTLYVYFTYGMHYCANVVTGAERSAGAVLLRAGEVTAGVELARRRRGEKCSDRDLARGPARLAQALGIDRGHNGLDLLAPTSPIQLRLPNHISKYTCGPRVGVGGDGASTPWRFWLPGSKFVSAYRPAVTRNRTSSQ